MRAGYSCAIQDSFGFNRTLSALISMMHSDVGHCPSPPEALEERLRLPWGIAHAPSWASTLYCNVVLCLRELVTLRIVAWRVLSLKASIIQSSNDVWSRDNAYALALAGSSSA